MKKLLLTFILLATSATLFFGSQLSAQIKVGSIQNGQAKLDLDDASITKTFAKILNGANAVDAQIKSAKDELGIFYYIAAKGFKKGEHIYNIALILDEGEGGSLNFIPNKGCNMMCENNSCSGCTQSIIVRCKSQKCSCSQGSGGCNSIITIYDDK